MKTLLTSIVLVLLAGCVSPSKSSYVPVTNAQLAQKMLRNDKSREYVWDHWRYAGSDAQYDYVYEYIPGSIVPYGFRFYKVPAGSVNAGVRYDFDPDFDNNALVF
jgi:hypothetical protein